MSRLKKLLLLPGFIASSCFLLLLRYILRTPQPLISPLPGDDHTYKWTHGQVFYKVHGDSNAPALLLLHAPGLGASAHEFLPIMEHLSSQYCVYAPDLLGFGLSDAPDIDYNADLFVTLCQDFLRDVVQKPATLFASGLSCNYAVVVASRSPELCDQLVLLFPPSAREIGMRPRLKMREIVQPRSADAPSRQSRGISNNTLFDTLLYAFLTPQIILRQIVRLQNAGRPGVSNDLTYYFAAAHQLGAQYAALAFVSGKLNLDIMYEKPLQPTLLLWNTAPRVNPIVQHYMSFLQAQILFINIEPHRVQALEARNVADAILSWQNTIHKEIPVSTGANIMSGLNGTERTQGEVTTPFSFPADVVENSQPLEPNLKLKIEDAPSPSTVEIEAFCVKCKQKRIMNEAQRIVTKNGRNAMEGICPVCNTKLFRFISSQNSRE